MTRIEAVERTPDVDIDSYVKEIAGWLTLPVFSGLNELSPQKQERIQGLQIDNLSPEDTTHIMDCALHAKALVNNGTFEEATDFIDGCIDVLESTFPNTNSMLTAFMMLLRVRAHATIKHARLEYLSDRETDWLLFKAGWYYVQADLIGGAILFPLGEKTAECFSQGGMLLLGAEVMRTVHHARFVRAGGRPPTVHKALQSIEEKVMGFFVPTPLLEVRKSFYRSQ